MAHSLIGARRALTDRFHRANDCLIRMRRYLPIVLGLLLATGRDVLAHPGRPPQPHDLWTTWGLDPGVLLGIGVAALAYRHGLRVLWTRAGAGRGISETQAFAFTAGLLVLAVALISPLDPLGSALFSAHMVQHLMLVLVAAPLLAMGAPVLAYLWTLPGPARHTVGRTWRGMTAIPSVSRRVVHPLFAWWLHALVLWAWHLPALYDLAVAIDWVHALEHLSFLLTAVLFWWMILPRGGGLRHAPGIGVLYVFTFALQNGILGASLALSSRPWYTAHVQSSHAWGLAPLEDQQIAGAVMWIPGSLVYLMAASALLILLLRAAEQRSRRLET